MIVECAEALRNPGLTLDFLQGESCRDPELREFLSELGSVGDDVLPFLISKAGEKVFVKFVTLVVELASERPLSCGCKRTL